MPRSSGQPPDNGFTVVAMSAQAGPAEQALRAAVESSCAIQVSREAAAAFLSSELDHWLDPSVPPDELDGLVLARLVTHEVRWVGQHLLSTDRLERLTAIRDRYVGRDPYLDAFLDCLLDKHEGRFWNRTYLALPVLEVLLAEHDLVPSGVAAMLAADIVRYELCAAHRLTEVSPVGRPDSRTLRTRMRHSLRFMTAHLGSAEAEGLLSAIAHEPESDLPALLLQLPTPPIALAGEWLELSVQPVSTVHDEYFFMRVLQAHEMAFTGMNRRVRDAIAAVRDEQLGPATSLLEEVVAFMDRNASLFRMVATMRFEAFHTFREFTDGASAIQSEQYKRFEGLCGLPPAARLASPAFESVPAVHAEVSEGQDTLTDAYRDALATGRHPAALPTIAGLLRALEDSHRRWKSTHVTLATRMLGDARGSGYTSGVGYLSEWVDHRLFWQLPEIGVTEARRRSA
jgi:tryptophan 2,3-dioxygenase